MKRYLISVLVLASLAAVTPALAAKSSSNGAQTYGWHLSGDVMPVPPYGSQDIPGSDTASKLIVNQPNGKSNVFANITGVMGGLAPNSTYTAYLSNVYTPFVDNGWSVAGNWVINFTCNFGCPAGPYAHDMMLTQNGSSLTVAGGYPSGGTHVYAWSGTGDLNDTTLHLDTTYTAGATCTMTIDGMIAPSGTMSGTWTDNCDGDRGGTWSTGTQEAIHNFSGSTTWPGLLGTAQPFTFTTDAEGASSWHVNLAGPVSGFSVWVNSAVTILISDPVHFF